MTPYAFIPLFSMIISLSLGSLVYSKSPDNPINKIFSIFCIAVSYWAFTEFEYLKAADHGTAIFWFKTGFLWPFSIALMLHFALVYTKKITPRNSILRHPPADT